MKTAVIINPASANGRTGRNLARIEGKIRSVLSPAFPIAKTQYPGHASILAREFIYRDAELIISVGGDGTLNEVLNGFYINPHDGIKKNAATKHESPEGGRGGFSGDFHINKRLINPEVALGTICMGTGGDFIRTLNWPRSLDKALQRVIQRKTIPLDVGQVDFTGPDKKAASRMFLNVADFGVGGAVTDRINRSSKALGGKLSFLIAILFTLPAYRSRTIRYRVDNGPYRDGLLYNFIVGNGRYYGGGIHALPHAKPDDGLLDIITIGDFTLAEALINLPRFMKGAHLSHPKIDWFQGKLVTASQINVNDNQPVLVELDGEVAGTLPATFKLAPEKLCFTTAA